jgi:glycosyltransferase involved in cell wall biosynthesis
MPEPTELASLPRVLVFSEGVISRSHGTGTIFERNFGSYPPEKLSNWFFSLSEDPLLPRTLNLNPHRWPTGNFSPPSTPLAKLWNHLFAKAAGRKWSVPVNHAAIRDAVRAQAHRERFDLVYAIVLTREGFDVLAAVLEGLGPRIPVILQIQDFFPRAHFGFWKAFRRIAPRISETWVVAPSIARAIESHFHEKPIRVDPLFNLELPTIAKTKHREFGPDFRAVVLGNFWNPALLADLKAAWRACQQRLPGLPPVRWHCHPAGLERVRAAGFVPGPEVEPGPFLSGDGLFTMLRDADLALIPFSREAEATTDYERYSLPSRITELAAIGLPIFCLTGRLTPLCDYVTKHGIGRCAPAGDTGRTADALSELIRDTAARARLGSAARAHAETHFPLQPFRNELVTRFKTVVANSTEISTS